MAGRIPQSFIDELLARADIVDIVGARVPLKRRGKEHIACCPFHNEKTPSFTVNQNKQFYHCFGCGAHGTALGFIMEYDRLDFVDAIEALAAEYHMDVPHEQGEHKADDRSGLYDVLQKASDTYRAQLKQSSRAIDYLKRRGLSGEVAKTFGLGYAPDSWDFLQQTLGAEHNSDLFKTGMLIEKSPNKYYDRFRDRIMFPIRDRRGRIIGFGGRILDKGEPKYLNSPETPLFHKGQELYGLFEAKQSVRDLTRIMVVEGYMDVVALAQHGIGYAVATLGTATSSEQISRLFRVVPEIIFCFDGDRAGRAAAWKALENTLPVLSDGVQAKFLFLPEPEDPDSLVRKEGHEAFEQRLQHAQPLSDFLLDQLSAQTDMSSTDGRARLAELAKPLLAKLPDGVFRDLLTNELAKRVGLSSQNIAQRMPVAPVVQHQPTTTTREPLPKPRESRHKIQITPGRLAIALLLQHPELATKVELPESLHLSGLAGMELLFTLHKVIRQTQPNSPVALVERFRESADYDALQKLMAWDIPESDNQNQQIKLLSDALERLQHQQREQRLSQLIEKSSQGSLTAEEKAELKLLYSQPNS